VGYARPLAALGSWGCNWIPGSAGLRYDGGHKLARFLVNTLGQGVEWGIRQRGSRDSGGGCFVPWASAAATPIPEALAARQPGARAHIKTAPWRLFRPVDKEPTVGLVLYPGGRVDSPAYAPIARSLSRTTWLSSCRCRCMWLSLRLVARHK
jgi:hypothetical protein